MLSFGVLRRVALTRTDVSEEHIASIIRVTRIIELGTTLMMEAIRFSETSVLTRATRRLVPEDDGIVESTVSVA
jgi:hypothetical protein